MRHLGDICAQVQLNDLISYPKNIGYNASGETLGTYDYNLSELLNSMFKSTRYLSVSSLIEETYFKTAKRFAIRGQQTQAMINSYSQCFEVVSEAMNSGQQESNMHIVNEFDRHNHKFIVIET